MSLDYQTTGIQSALIGLSVLLAHMLNDVLKKLLKKGESDGSGNEPADMRQIHKRLDNHHRRISKVEDALREKQNYEPD
jgi:hypothetical protein